MAKDKDKKKDKKDKKKEKKLLKEQQKLLKAAAESSNASGRGSSRRSRRRRPAKMSRKEFEKEMKKLQVELVKLQEWVKATGAKICVVFEGRDTAGKGGVIRRITERVSPRVFRVVALSSPTEREKSQMYFQRYMPHLPAAGEVVLFDRSWYNRAGVERVMGFATQEQVEHFLKFAPAVEREIVHSGVYPDQVLAGSGHGGAGQAVQRARRRLSQDLEAQPDGFASPGPLVRLFPGTRCYV